MRENRSFWCNGGACQAHERLVAVPQHAPVKTVGVEVRLDRLDGLVAIEEDQPESHRLAGRATLHTFELRQVASGNRTVGASEHEHCRADPARGERLQAATCEVGDDDVARLDAARCWRDTCQVRRQHRR